MTVGGTPAAGARKTAVHNLEIAEACHGGNSGLLHVGFRTATSRRCGTSAGSCRGKLQLRMPRRERLEVDNAPDVPSPFEQPAVPMTPAPRPRTRRKVIAFPRQLMATPDVAYRLADPVMPEQPRILDVPEELEAVTATPFLDGLTFEGKSERPVGPDQVELPFRPIRASQRATRSWLMRLWWRLAAPCLARWRTS